MPTKLKPHEVNLHVPIPKHLRAEVMAQAKEDGVLLREAVQEALGWWVGQQRLKRTFWFEVYPLNASEPPHRPFIDL